MEYYIFVDSREYCQSYSVHVDHEALFGFENTKETIVEAPVSVRRGVYGVDFIGVFTNLGGRETLVRHVSMIGIFCYIASNIASGQVEHPTDFLSAHPLFTGSASFGHSSVNDAKAALDKITSAISLTQTAYRSLYWDDNKASQANGTIGPGSARQQAQLAPYQAALQRLSAGSSSGLAML